MRFHWKLKIAGLLLIIAIFIAFPFFRIKYFEIFSTLLIIYHYFLIPLVIASMMGAIFLYRSCLKRFNPPTRSKTKAIVQDVFSIGILTWVFTAILCALTLSAIITTNAYLGPQKVITINEPVLKFETDVTRYGRARHYVTFMNPNDNSLIRLEAYKKYKVGESFTKKMKIGRWGQLYSFE